MSDTYQFTHALCRTPSRSAVDGLRAVDHGAPDIDEMLRDHADYVRALRSTGAEVTVLPPLDVYPDAHFVEDAALCLREGAVLMRPGAPTRAGEVAHMAPHLRELYGGRVRELPDDVSIEGGDILVTEREILVGRSDRTSAAGIAALREIVSDWRYTVREVITPPTVLHFKTDCSLLDANTVLATQRLAASGCFDGYAVILTAEGEEAAANAIRFNDLVVFPKGFPKTAERLRAAGYKVSEIGNEPCAKLDGGMSCLSLRFSPQV